MLELENKELKETVGELTQKIKELKEASELNTKELQILRQTTVEDLSLTEGELKDLKQLLALMKQAS